VQDNCRNIGEVETAENIIDE